MKNIVLDFDGCVYNSIKRFVGMYNRLYYDNVDYQTCKTWDFKECKKIKSRQEVFDIFNRDDFYQNKETYFIKDAIRAVKYLSKKHNVTIVTCGTKESNFNKQKLCEEIFPKCNFVGITNSNSIEVGKDLIVGDIILDDHVDNLSGNKSKYILLFEPMNEMDWNIGWNGRIIKTWTEFIGEVEY